MPVIPFVSKTAADPGTFCAFCGSSLCGSSFWDRLSVEILAKVSRPRRAAGGDATIPYVTVFKQLPGSHMHVRTPIMLGVILVLVILMSGFCYYRVGSNLGISDADAVVPGFVSQRF
jgi:hypothetical protein